MPSSLASNPHIPQDYAQKEAERFQTFYDDMLSIHGLLENIQNITLRRQFREIVNKIEDDFVGDADFTCPRSCLYKTLRLGIVGGSLSGKSSLIQRFITGTNPKEDVMPGKHKIPVFIQDNTHLLLIRDETGTPDNLFSQWADAVLLVFNIYDELSFNVISSYYAKMVQFRLEKDLPCFLVAVKDGMNLNSSNGSVAESRIKKFIGEHRQCPFFVVSLETGENVHEVFQTAAEKILQYQNLGYAGSYDSLLSASYTSLSTTDSTLQGPPMTPSINSLKKNKRRNTLFSLKSDKKQEEIIVDDIGSGRHIPIKQGYLYKKSNSSLKDWKKKYVIITNSQTFSYYSSMKDYMEDNNAKTIELIHANVKTPPKRNRAALLQRSNSRTSKSTQNLHLGVSPVKSVPTEGTKPIDCYVLSNNSTTEPGSDNTSNLLNGSPTIQYEATVERSASDGKDSTLRVTHNYDSFSTKRKHRKTGSRHKSCEIDFQAENDHNSDHENNFHAPTTPVTKKKGIHRRQKSNANLKDIGIESRSTDTEDEDYIFTLTTIDSRTWDFECTSIEERDGWIRAIEGQILKAFQLAKSNSLTTTEMVNGSEKNTTDGGVLIKEILSCIPGNDKCVDCGNLDPEWASLNLGVLFCIECSGVHRNLGSHLSRVRSILLDDWPSEALAVMKLLGNKFGNEIWESRLQKRKKPLPNCSREEREAWITSKYEKKEFLSPSPVQNNFTQSIMSSVLNEDLPSCYKLLINSHLDDVNKLTDVNGSKMAPLHMSCAKANIPLTQLLLWYHADPKIVDEHGYNPIYFAHKSNSKECAGLLFQYGCPEDTPC